MFAPKLTKAYELLMEIGLKLLCDIYRELA
jgi:hypothetical protein